MKFDPLIRKTKTEQNTAKLMVANQDNGHEPDLSSTTEEPVQYSKQYNVYQPEFDLCKALRNIQVLSDHFIIIFRFLMSKQPEGEFLPKKSDLRCSMLAYHLLLWEMQAILAPEQMRLDIFELLKIRGCAILTAFLDPNGRRLRSEKRRKKTKFRKYVSNERSVQEAMDKIEPILMSHKVAGRNFNLKSRGLSEAEEFENIWRQIVPKSFAQDRQLMDRIWTLNKFRHLCYSVVDINQPRAFFEDEAPNGCRRQTQKTVRMRYGV